MATPVVMPALGMTMEEGRVAEWLAADGQLVERGQLIVRLSTDKIEMEVEADASGVLRHLVAADATAPSGAVVAYILAEGETLPAEFTAAAERSVAQRSGVTSQASLSGRQDRGGNVQEAPPAAASAEVRASPLAKRLANEHGIDLASIQGSGPGGRIVQEDVERAIAQQAAPVSQSQPTPVQGQTVPFRGVRRTIADRMQHSLQSTAQLTLTMDVDTTDTVKMVAQVREEWRRQGVHLTYIDPIIKAVAQALTEYPRLNAILEGDAIRLLPEVNIGIAVALGEGLIVPVVRQADGKSVREIAREVHELSAKAHAGTLTLDEVSGGTFTVTSLAAYDVDIFTPIINPPQAAILGVGRVREAPSFEGERVVRRMMTHLSLSFDHRVTDGAPAAQFLRRVRNLLERPSLLLF